MSAVAAVEERPSTRLWEQHRREQTKASRNRLVEHYAPLVRRIAVLRSRALGGAEFDDLVSSGTIGLIDAVERFDPWRGVSFQAFAHSRISGAMVDDLRQLDPLPRSARERIGTVDEATDALGGELGRRPTDDEVAAALGFSAEQVQTSRRLVHASRMVSLDAPLPGGDRPDVADPVDVPPEVIAEDAEERRELVALVNRLPERFRLVVALHDFEERTLAEIGRMLGVTESRASQMRKCAIEELRSMVAPPPDPRDQARRLIEQAAALLAAVPPDDELLDLITELVRSPRRSRRPA